MRVVITGANRGIGAALAARYSARGDEVIGTARGDAATYPLDVANPVSVDAFANQIGSSPIDLLICNAGVFLDRGEDMTSGYGPDLWAQTFATNVTGVFLTVQKLLPQLRAASGGKVAIISSRMGSSAHAKGNGMIYRASKAAALNLGRNMAVNLAPDGVALGIYHPGWVRTDMGGSAADLSVDEAADGLVARFDALSVKTTGCFETWDGTALPH